MVAVRIVILTMLTLLGASAQATDGASSDDACGCSIVHAHGMMPTYDEDERYVIFLGNRGRELYLGIEVFEYNEFGQGSLASNLVGYMVRRDITPKSDLSYTRVSGLPAAFIEYKARYTGLAVRQRTYVIDAGDRLLAVSVFGSNRLWYDNAARVDDLIASMDIEPHAFTAEDMGWAVDLLPGTLPEARAEHVTESVEPYHQRVLPRAPDGVPYTRVAYETALGDMVLYRSPLPDADHPAPAVIWLPPTITSTPDERVWDISGEEPMSAEPFRMAGLVVVVPSFRGMAKNPGEHEYLYGEVDDLLAAIQAVRRMPGVHPSRVYLAGAGYGGTLALLATASGAPVRATMTFDANPWLFPQMAAGGFVRQPWDVTDERSQQLRSPVHWADDLSAPVLQVVASGSVGLSSRRMQALAEQSGRSFHVVNAPYEELRSTLPSVKEVFAELVRTDRDEEFDPEVSEEVLHDAAIRRYGRRLGYRR